VPQSRLLPTRHPWAPLAGRGPQGACGARWSSGRRAPECTYCRDVPTSSASEQRKPAPSHLRGAHRPREPHTGPPRTATANLTTQATERISMSLPNVRRYVLHTAPGLCGLRRQATPKRALRNLISRSGSVDCETLQGSLSLTRAGKYDYRGRQPAASRLRLTSNVGLQQVWAQESMPTDLSRTAYGRSELPTSQASSTKRN